MVVAARNLGFSIAEIKAMAELDAGAQRNEAVKRVSRIRSSVAELSQLADRVEELSECECADKEECYLTSA